MKVIAPWLDIFGASSLALAAMVAGYFLRRIDHLVPETLLPVPVPVPVAEAAGGKVERPTGQAPDRYV